MATTHAEPAGPPAPVPPAQRRRGPQPRTVLAIASLGAAMAFVDATIVNIAFPDIARSYPERVDRVLVVDPERLQHRVRGVPDRRGPIGGPGRPAARVHLGARAVHDRLRAVRDRLVPRRAHRLPCAAGARRRAARPLLAGAGAGRVPARAPLARRRAAVGRRRRGRGARPVARRAPRGRRQLAAGVSGQPADRRGRDRAHSPPPRGEPRPGTAPRAGPDGRARACAGDRRARARRRQGRRVGLAQRARPRVVRAGGRARRALRQALHDPSGADRRPLAPARPDVRRHQRHDDRHGCGLLRLHARQRAVPDRGLAVLRARGGTRDDPRTRSSPPQSPCPPAISPRASARGPSSSRAAWCGPRPSCGS